MAAISPIPLHKIKMIQILMNLITNAKEAMDNTPEDRKSINFILKEQNKTIQLKVIDTGCGVPSEYIDLIFSHGFTTKKGKQGFGLHNSANHMAEMDGRIWAESKGEDKGAAFILEFKK
ncbi:MAG: ATP-binding protein [Proteobacteria bacterium]|nr:ATP-binding protein [Pseudomonadota bacterium]